MSVMRNRKLAHVMLESGREAFDDIGEKLKRVRWFFEGKLDPNDWRLVKKNSIGLRYVPLSTNNHARIGTRERVLEIACKYPDRLRVELNALATRVLFDDHNRAIGVEYLKGRRLYRAHAQQQSGNWRVAPLVRFARSDSRWRRFQHATIPDAFRYRATRCARRSTHSCACRFAGCW